MSKSRNLAHAPACKFWRKFNSPPQIQIKFRYWKVAWLASKKFRFLKISWCAKNDNKLCRVTHSRRAFGRKGRFHQLLTANQAKGHSHVTALLFRSMKATGLRDLVLVSLVFVNWNMAMGRGLRAFHINQAGTTNQPYSVILEQRGRNDVLLFENYTVASLGRLHFKNSKITSLSDF